jgi:hypothetical protein
MANPMKLITSITMTAWTMRLTVKANIINTR